MLCSSRIFADLLKGEGIRVDIIIILSLIRPTRLLTETEYDLKLLRKCKGGKDTERGRQKLRDERIL